MKIDREISEIRLGFKTNLPRYTIVEKTTVEGKYIRQTSSGGDCFAILTLKIEPDEERELIIFENNISEINLGHTILYPQINNDKETENIIHSICTGICAGIEKACLDLEQKKYIVMGMKVTALSAMYHPVDSRSRCYNMATYLALLDGFKKVGLTKIVL